MDDVSTMVGLSFLVILIITLSPGNNCDMAKCVDSLMEHDISIIIKNKLWKHILTPGDGHCLIHAIVESWENQLTAKPAPSYEDMIAWIFIETLNNRDKYLVFLNGGNKQKLSVELKEYLLNKQYDNCMGDIIPYIIASAYAIRLLVIDVSDGQQHLHEITLSKPHCGTVVIHKFRDHYSSVRFNPQALSFTPTPGEREITIRYDPAELKPLNSLNYNIPRKVRKKLFSLKLWRPKSHGQMARNGVHQNNLKSPDKTNLIFKVPKPMKFAMVNTCSIRNKTEDFLHHVSLYDYDACAVCETWLREEDPADQSIISQLKEANYDFVHSPRHDIHRGGGIGLVFKSNIDVKVLRNNCYSTFEMCLWKFSFSGDHLVVMCVYRPPYSAKHRNTIRMFIEEFTEVWSDILSTYSNNRLMLVGDFNVHIDDKDALDAQAFSEALATYECSQLVRISTHTSGHTLDLCIVPNDSDLIISDPVADYFISDHTFVSFDVCYPKPHLKRVHVQFRCVTRMDKEAFQNDLSEVSGELLQLAGENLAKEYNAKLSNIFNKHAPLKKKMVYPRKKVAWFNNEAKELKAKLRKLEKHWRKSRSQEHLDVLKVARQVYRKHLKESKSAHFRDAINSAKGDPRQLFAITNGLMGKNKSNLLPPGKHEELAEQFADFFASKIESIRDSLSSTERYQPKGTDTGKLFQFNRLTVDQIKKRVSTSKPTSCSTDPLPSNLIKDNIEILAPVITKLVNDSLHLGQFYDHWKLAVVVPLLKKVGLDLVCSNYRPVSNLAFISKIVEKTVIEQLNEHMSLNDLHSAHQSAYKSNFSTETALCFLMNRLLWSMEKGEVVVMAALDLSAAFDTVDHQVLISVLKQNFGVEGIALNWIKTYLANRQMHIKVNDSTSSVRTFNYSVPQGSCLGPVFFNIYSSTILECIESTQDLGGYADDHYLCDSFKPSDPQSETSCIDRIETSIDHIISWMSANVLKINAAKTEVTLFASRQLLPKVCMNQLRVGSERVSTGDTIKYLGIYLDSSLTLQKHIQSKCKVAIFNIRNISQIRKFIDISTAKLLASALVLSHLDYSNSILCGLPGNAINRLQRVQNWAAKVVLGLSKYDSSREALRSLHWLPVKQRIDFKILCIIFKCLHNMAPEYLSNLIQEKAFARNTRLAASSGIILVVPFTRRSTFASRSFSVYGPRLWNGIPAKLRNMKNFDCFKRHLKTFLFESF